MAQSQRKRAGGVQGENHDSARRERHLFTLELFVTRRRWGGVILARPLGAQAPNCPPPQFAVKCESEASTTAAGVRSRYASEDRDKMLVRSQLRAFPIAAPENSGRQNQQDTVRLCNALLLG